MSKSKSKGKLFGFTTAETMLILFIIGVIALLVVPTMFNNIRDFLFAKQRKVAEETLAEGFRRMRVNGALVTDYKNSYYLIPAMGKYFGFSKTCHWSQMDLSDYNNPECFSQDFYDSDGSKYSLDNFRPTLQQLKTSTLDSDMEDMYHGFVLENGTYALIHYNGIIISRSDLQTDIFAPFSIMYDVNGLSGPNVIGRDIGAINSYFGALLDYKSGPFTTAQCMDAKHRGVPVYDCGSVDKDYWAAAAYSCYKQSKRLPTYDEMEALGLDQSKYWSNTCGATTCIKYRTEGSGSSAHTIRDGYVNRDSADMETYCADY